MRVLFAIARELGMTVQDLGERMTLEELQGWQAYMNLLEREK